MRWPQRPEGVRTRSASIQPRGSIIPGAPWVFLPCKRHHLSTSASRAKQQQLFSEHLYKGCLHHERKRTRKSKLARLVLLCWGLVSEEKRPRLTAKIITLETWEHVCSTFSQQQRPGGITLHWPQQHANASGRDRPQGTRARGETKSSLCWASILTSHGVSSMWKFTYIYSFSTLLSWSL